MIRTNEKKMKDIIKQSIQENKNNDQIFEEWSKYHQQSQR